MSDRYSLQWRSSARKELSGLDRQVRARVLRKIDALASDPRPPGAMRLVGAGDLWRIRIGDYRVVYTIEDAQLTIIIVRVAGRGKVYRGL